MHSASFYYLYPQSAIFDIEKSTRTHNVDEKMKGVARENEVCCILTGTNTKENKKINDFVNNHNAFGTAGIHPHNADCAKLY